MVGAWHPTRRQLLGRGLQAGGLAAGAGAGPLSGLAVAGVAPAGQSDAELLSTMLAVELLAEFVLHTVLLTGLLPAHPQRVVQLILEHEQVHADLLSTELRRRGVSPPSAPTTTTAADQLLTIYQVSEPLAGLAHAKDALKLLLDLEAVAERVYYRAMSRLSGPQLLRTAAGILANEAQHYTAIGQLQHPRDFSKSVPDAFVEGA